jgi:hypothetical protein
MREVMKAVRNVRNFWLELEVDGKPTKIATGPKSKDGGFLLTVYVREEGHISNKQLHVRGSVNHDGTLSLSLTLDGGAKDYCEHEDGSLTASMGTVQR